MMGPDDDDRRGISIERSLGRIESSQKGLDNRLDRFENTVNSNNNEAQESRRRLHQLLEKQGAEVGQVKERLRIVEIQTEDMGNKLTMFAPMGVVNELSAAHAAVEKSVAELKSAKDKVEGAAEGMKHLGKGIWALMVAIGGAIGGGLFAMMERFFHNGFPPAGPPH